MSIFYFLATCDGTEGKVEAKNVIIGLVIFIIVTGVVFLVLNFFLENEIVTVISSLIVGGLAEFIYRKKKRSTK